MTLYYATAWKTGVYPAITKNRIYLSSRPAPKAATASSDSVGIPTSWQWVSGFLLALLEVDQVLTS